MKNNSYSLLYSKYRISMLHIIPGLYCNFSCNHCGNNSGPKHTERLAAKEITLLKSTIKKYNPQILLFTGGEPTFYFDEINNIIQACHDLTKTEIFITTNGWYAQSSNIYKTLGKLIKIDRLQLSFDTFHQSKLKINDVKLLRDYCKKNNIKFNVSVCISSPIDLIATDEIQKQLQEPVIYQKVEACGRAKNTGKQYNYPAFEKDVLSKKCPNIGQITYLCNRGFTICCSNLVFNAPKCKNFISVSLDKHLSSTFYNQQISKTFSEMLIERNMFAVALKPEHSSPCGLCEFINATNECRN